jgi:TetR/AcrR family transcriptional regulator
VDPVDASAANRDTPPNLRPGIAERLWEASRIEFSLRGYHGARVQGIARRAGCNVALLYRHWSSKKALYLDVLRSMWQGMLREVVTLVEAGRGAPAVVGAYLDANMRDTVGAQILIREFLDGGPFLSQLIAAEPALVEPLKRVAGAIAENGPEGQAFRSGVDPMLAVFSIGGLAALVASAHDASRPFFAEPLAPDAWRKHLYDLILHGIVACPTSPADCGAVPERAPE